ncbi:hypothetical protein V3C99_002675, partial [Haemonchus contortus]
AVLSYVHRFEESLRHRRDRSGNQSPGQPGCTYSIYKDASAALENIMRHLEWEDLGVKVDGRYLHHLRFADDIVLITPNIE